jgi:hypothetical protein
MTLKALILEFILATLLAVVLIFLLTTGAMLYAPNSALHHQTANEPSAMQVACLRKLSMAGWCFCGAAIDNKSSHDHIIRCHMDLAA